MRMREGTSIQDHERNRLTFKYYFARIGKRVASKRTTFDRM